MLNFAITGLFPDQTSAWLENDAVMTNKKLVAKLVTVICRHSDYNRTLENDAVMTNKKLVAKLVTVNCRHSDYKRNLPYLLRGCDFYGLSRVVGGGIIILDIFTDYLLSTMS